MVQKIKALADDDEPEEKALPVYAEALAKHEEATQVPIDLTDERDAAEADNSEEADEKSRPKSVFVADRSGWGGEEAKAERKEEAKETAAFEEALAALDFGDKAKLMAPMSTPTPTPSPARPVPPAKVTRRRVNTGRHRAHPYSPSNPLNSGAPASGSAAPAPYAPVAPVLPPVVVDGESWNFGSDKPKSN